MHSFVKLLVVRNSSVMQAESRTDMRVLDIARDQGRFRGGDKAVI